MLAIIKEYQDIDLDKGLHETQDILNKISTRLNGVDVAFSKIVKSFISSAVTRGYDHVAYFTENNAIKGSPDFTYENNGAT